MTDAALLSPPWDDMTLPGLAKGYAMVRPQQVLFRETEVAADVLRRPVRQIDGQGFHAAARLMASQLRDLGIVEGEHVLVVAPNGIETLIAILATMLAGAVPAVLPVFAQSDEIRQAMELTQAAGVITVSRFSGLTPARHAAAAAKAQIDIRFVAAFGADCPAGVARLDEWTFRPDEVAQRLPRIRGGDCALVTFDTANGTMRAYSRTHSQLIAETLQYAAAAQIAPDSRIIATLAPATVAGLCFSLCAPLLCGCAADLLPLFDSCSFAARLGDGAGTILVLPAGAEAALRHYRDAHGPCSETNVYVHRVPVNALRSLPPLPETARTIDVAWFGECFGLTIRRSGSPVDRTMYRHPDIAPGALHISATPRQLLTIDGPLAPRLLQGGGVLETPFSPQAIRNLAGGFELSGEPTTVLHPLRRAG